MNAAEVLERSGLDTHRAPGGDPPGSPRVGDRKTAPAVMRRAWGKGIQAMTLGNTVYVDPG